MADIICVRTIFFRDILQRTDDEKLKLFPQSSGSLSDKAEFFLLDNTGLILGQRSTGFYVILGLTSVSAPSTFDYSFRRSFLRVRITWLQWIFVVPVLVLGNVTTTSLGAKKRGQRWNSSSDDCKVALQTFF